MGMVLVAVPLVFELVFVGGLAIYLGQAESDLRRHECCQAIMGHANALSAAIYDAGAAVVGFRSTQNPVLRERYITQLQSMPELLSGLDSAIVDSNPTPAQQKSLKKIAQLVSASIQIMKEAESGDPAVSAERVLIRNKRTFDMILSLSKELNSELQVLTKNNRQYADLQESKKLRRRYRQLLSFLLSAGIIFSILLAAALAVLFVKGINDKLKVVADNSLRLSKGEPLNSVLKGADEISKLDQVFHDMADALAEASLRERAIVDNAADVICSIDTFGKFTAMNPAAYALWSYDPKELIGSDYSKLLLPEDYQLVDEAISQAVKQKQATFESRIVKKDREVAYMLWSVRWVKRRDALFCVLHDITDRKKLEQLKQQFIAIVSHDLRTPLTGITMWLSGLTAGVRGQLPAALLGDIEKMKLNTTRLVHMINDLLDIEKLDAGRMDFMFTDVLLQDLLHQAVEVVSPLANDRKLQFVFCGQEMHVVVDADRMMQVLVNLLSNAVKFSPDCGTITLSIVDGVQDARVEITDQGPGVPPEFQQSIFERFTQIQPSQRGGGTGLGLPIARLIVCQHGGSIGVTSLVGSGSTFWFEIPKTQGLLMS